jgi:two-component system cell cycle sensor histidine kinase PleC
MSAVSLQSNQRLSGSSRWGEKTMKIRARLRLNTWISLGVISLAIAIFAWSFLEVYRADRNVLFIDEIREATFERIALRDNYLLNPSEELKIKWYAKSETLRTLLESASERFTGKDDRALIQEARKNFDITFSSFSTILEKQRQEEPADRKKLAFGEEESKLLSQVFLNADALNNSGVRLYESLRGAAITARNRGAVFIILFVVGSVITISIHSLFIGRIIRKRLTVLHEGVKVITGGNLDHRIDIVGDDELADLAQASNEMVTKIKESHEFAESVINTVREPLIALDQDLRVVKVSRSFYDFFQVNPEETVGQLIYDLGNKQWDIPKLRELLETILPQKTTFDDYEVEHNFATIGRRIMLLNARQIERASGKERIILLAIEDITERKAIENGLKKAHEELSALATELKRASRAKSEFLANMSHELRTPLNSIIGFSEILYDKTFGPLNEKQKHYTNNVLTSGKHLLLLINQILDMAKVESGKMNLTLSRIPMKSLLGDISLLVADMVSQKKIEMLLEIAEDVPNIEADDLKVKQILYNLLSNAVKFTPEGGKIGIRAEKADFEIKILVWDTGVGIELENMERIFEGFFRVDTPYSRITEGTGLGLPLSKKLVELHGGQLSVKSEGLQKGTSVQFTLPIAPRKVV